MPLEVRELVIKVAIEDGQPDSKASESGQPVEDREGLIADCVAQVMELLREKEMR